MGAELKGLRTNEGFGFRGLGVYKVQGFGFWGLDGPWAEVLRIKVRGLGFRGLEGLRD